MAIVNFLLLNFVWLKVKVLVAMVQLFYKRLICLRRSILKKRSYTYGSCDATVFRHIFVLYVCMRYMQLHKYVSIKLLAQHWKL